MNLWYKIQSSKKDRGSVLVVGGFASRMDCAVYLVFPGFDDMAEA